MSEELAHPHHDLLRIHNRLKMVPYIVLIAVAFVVSSIGCLFDSSGRLYQVEYANKAVNKGATSISLKSDDYVVHVIYASQKSSLALSLQSSPLKVRPLNDYLAISATGIVSDANHIVNRAFEEVLNEKTRFGMAAEPAPSRLASSLALYMGEKTLASYQRPYGVTAVLLGYDATSPTPQGKTCIYEVDPIGNCNNCKLCCVGSYSTELAQRICSDKTQLNQASSMGVSNMVQRSIETVVELIKEEEDVDVDVDSDIRVYVVGRNTPFCQLDQELVSRAFSTKDYSSLQLRLGLTDTKKSMN